MGNTSKILTFVAGIAIGMLFLWIAVRDVDIGQVATALKSANFVLVLPFLLALAIFYWLKARRWAYLLAPARTFSDRQLFPPMILGFAGNNVLPIRLGELLRIYLLGHEYRISKTLVLATLVLERVFDALCLLALVAIALFATEVVSDALSTAGITLAVVSAAAIVLVIVVVRPPAVVRSLVVRSARLLPESIGAAIDSRVRAVQQGFAAISSPRSIALITANSFAQWLLLAGCILLSMRAFDVPPDVTASIVVLGLIVVGISLPSAPGFIGTIEVCFVVGLGLFDVGASQALAVAIFYHVLTFGFVTLFGLVLLPRYRRILASGRGDVAATDPGGARPDPGQGP